MHLVLRFLITWVFFIIKVQACPLPKDMCKPDKLCVDDENGIEKGIDCSGLRGCFSECPTGSHQFIRKGKYSQYIQNKEKLLSI